MKDTEHKALRVKSNLQYGNVVEIECLKCQLISEIPVLDSPIKMKIEVGKIYMISCLCEPKELK